MTQGLDIRDVAIVVQWKVPRDLNTVMQHFGLGARDPELQAVAILIAEPSWFYEVQMKKQQTRESRRRRHAEKAGKAKKRRLNNGVPGYGV